MRMKKSIRCTQLILGDLQDVFYFIYKASNVAADTAIWISKIDFDQTNSGRLPLLCTNRKGYMC